MDEERFKTDFKCFMMNKAQVHRCLMVETRKWAEKKHKGVHRIKIHEETQTVSFAGKKRDRRINSRSARITIIINGCN